MIGIIGAMNIEIEKIDTVMKNKSEKEIAGIKFVKGELNGKQAVCAVCGIGKVAAAICAQAMITAYKPECVINTGVAGSLSDSLSIRDVVIADFLVEHDMDTTALGDCYGYISGLDIVDIPADKKVNKALTAAAERLGVKAVTGKIASGDQFIADREKKAFIANTFGAVACEMEGAAIAQTCYSNKIPFGVVRAISDCADGSSHMDYAEFVPLAASDAAKIIENFAELY